MPSRLAATAAGILIIALGVLAFAVVTHSEVVAGTNGVEPFHGTVEVPSDAKRCQLVPLVPSGADRLRMRASSLTGGRTDIRAAITDAEGPISSGTVTRERPGAFTIALSPRTRPSFRATLCLSNLGPGTLVLAGEVKKVRPLSGNLSIRKVRPIASAIFLEPNSSSWIDRASTIVDRFGYSHAGAVGTWALWVGGLLAIVAFGLAFALAVRGSPREDDQSRTPPATVRARLATIPVAGLLCALVALLCALTWSLFVPLFQIPDEQAHVGYAQYMAEAGRPPAGVLGASSLSDEERHLLRALRWRQITHRPDNVPFTTEADHRRLEKAVEAPADRKSEGGSSNAASNPPLYYVAAASAYRLSPRSDLPDRVHAMRLVSSLLAAITVLLIFCFLRELLPAVPWAWSVGALAVALQPMFGFIGGGVNNDNLLFAASAGVLLALAASFRRGLTVRRGVALGAFTAVGLLAKVTMVGLFPGIAVGLGLLVYRATPEKRREAVRGVIAAGAAIAAPVLVYLLLNSTVWDRGLFFGSGSGQTAGKAPLSRPDSISGHLSYVWQFYLPRLPFMESWFDTYQARGIWINGFVGRFGWLDYGFGRWVQDLALFLGAVILGLAGREVYLRREALRGRLWELLTYALVAVGLLATLGWIGYIWRLGHPGQFEQARYLLPLLGLYGALIALAARGAGRRYGPAAGILIVSLAIAQSAVALLMTLSRYYG